MGLRAQFERLVELQLRWGNKAGFFLVYGREAFPQESKWPAPVPDGKLVSNPTTVPQRCQVARRFQANVSRDITILIDDLNDSAMERYDAFPFRVYAVDAQGKIAVRSVKGAAGFEETLNRIDAWLSELDK